MAISNEESINFRPYALQYRDPTARKWAVGRWLWIGRRGLFPRKCPILRRLNFKRGASFVIRHALPPASPSDVVSTLETFVDFSRLRPQSADTTCGDCISWNNVKIMPTKLVDMILFLDLGHFITFCANVTQHVFSPL